MTMWGDAGEGNHTLRATDVSAVLSATAGAGLTNVLAIIDEKFLNNDMAMAAGAQCSQPSSTAGSALTLTTAPAMGVANVAITGDDLIASTCMDNKPCFRVK